MGYTKFYNKRWVKPRRRRKRAPQGMMTKANKSKLLYIGGTIALLVFVPSVYLQISKAVGRA